MPYSLVHRFTRNTHFQLLNQFIEFDEIFIALYATGKHPNTYMEQSPSWEANRSSSSQEIPRILWNPKAHYRIHKSPLSVLVLSQIDEVHVSRPTSRRPILILSSHLCLGLPSGLLFPGFRSKTLYAPLLCHMRATCPVHVTVLDLITRMMFGEEYRA